MESKAHIHIKTLKHLSALLNDFNLYFSSKEIFKKDEAIKKTLQLDFELHKKMSLELDERTQVLGGNIAEESDKDAQWITLLKGINGCQNLTELYREVKTYIIKRYEEYRDKLEPSVTRDLIKSHSSDLIFAFEKSQELLKTAA